MGLNMGVKRSTSKIWPLSTNKKILWSKFGVLYKFPKRQPSEGCPRTTVYCSAYNRGGGLITGILFMLVGRLTMGIGGDYNRVSCFNLGLYGNTHGNFFCNLLCKLQ